MTRAALTFILLLTVSLFPAGMYPRIIPQEAFSGDTTLTEYTIEADITEIGAEAFRDCTALKRIIFAPGSTLSKIGDRAFIYCGDLEEIELPTTLRSIGSNAFSCCGSLQEIKIPEEVSSVESYAFSSCSSLRRATLPAAADMLGELIFSCCRNLMTITVPAAIPPEFECRSQLFEPDEENWEKTILYVPAGSEHAYRHAPGWDRFVNILPIKKQP